MLVEERDQLAPRHADPKWYGVAYNYVVAQRLFQEDKRARKRPKLEDVIREAASLLLIAARARRGSGPPMTGGGVAARRRLGRALDQYLDGTVEPCTAVLLAGMLFKERRPQDQPRITSRSDLIGSLTALLDDKPGRANAEALIRYVESRDVIGYRVRYNLACYHARAAARYRAADRREASESEQEQALEELETALRDCPLPEQAALASWAKVDPALGALQRGKQDVRSAFQRLTEAFGAGKKTTSRRRQRRTTTQNRKSRRRT